MLDKWEKMTPEEKQRFKDEWKTRCKGGWRGGPFSDRDFPTHEPEAENK
jgi:hypothetical protein